MSVNFEDDVREALAVLQDQVGELGARLDTLIDWGGLAGWDNIDKRLDSLSESVLRLAEAVAKVK